MNPFKIWNEKRYPPAEVKHSFEGKTVLVTGANTGLGLEAAKKLAALNPERLIITTRSEAKGEATRKTIETWLSTKGPASTTKTVTLQLDMSSHKGVESFVSDLSKTTARLDAAILNAGVNHPDYIPSPDNMEETVQVNTISTVYLMTLLIPLMISTAKSTSEQTHLTIVSSRTAVFAGSFPSEPSARTALTSSTPLTDLSRPHTFPGGFMGGQQQYGRSKLLLEYCIRRLARNPSLNHPTSGAPYLIINSVCPGMCTTDLGRDYAKSLVLNFVIQHLLPVLAKTAEQGADAYLNALIAGDDSMGEMSAAGVYVPAWDALRSDKGKRLGDAVWEEMKDLMRNYDKTGAVQDVVGARA